MTTRYSDYLDLIETNLYFLRQSKTLVDKADVQAHNELNNAITYHEIWFDDLVTALERNESSAIGIDHIELALCNLTAIMIVKEMEEI